MPVKSKIDDIRCRVGCLCRLDCLMLNVYYKLFQFYALHDKPRAIQNIRYI